MKGQQSRAEPSKLIVSYSHWLPQFTTNSINLQAVTIGLQVSWLNWLVRSCSVLFRGVVVPVAVSVGGVSVALFSSLSKFRCFSFCLSICFVCFLCVNCLHDCNCECANLLTFLYFPTLQFVLSIILYLAASCPVLSGAVLAFPLSFPFPFPFLTIPFSFLCTCG